MSEDIVNPNKETVVNKIEYPFEYFDAQVQFAKKWSEINNIPFAQALLKNTALYRRLTNKKPSSNIDPLYEDLVKKVTNTLDIDNATKVLYNAYLQQSHSLYHPLRYPINDGKHFGFFSYDYYPNNPLNDGRNTIKIHFLNLQRGDKNSLHPDLLQQRRLDLKKMFEHIEKAYPHAKEVLGGSWLYALKSYKDSFPEEFIQNMRKMVPPGFEDLYPNSVPTMSFQGNSLWGQFVDRYGWSRKHVYNQFILNIKTAKSAKDLFDSFPNTPLQPHAPISVFYQWQPK